MRCNSKSTKTKCICTPRVWAINGFAYKNGHVWDPLSLVRSDVHFNKSSFRMDHGILCANEASITILCGFSISDSVSRCGTLHRIRRSREMSAGLERRCHVVDCGTTLECYPCVTYGNKSSVFFQSQFVEVLWYACVHVACDWTHKMHFHWTGSWEFLESSHNFHQVSGAQIKATSAYWCEWMVRSSNFAFLCKAGQIDIAWQQVYTDANPWL